MSTKPLKIPKQLRVTFQDQEECEYDEEGKFIRKIPLERLGFAQVYAPTTAAFANLKKTQDNWAYRDGMWARRSGYEEIDGKIWTQEGAWQTIDGESVWVDGPRFMVPEHLQPVVIDNVPLEGYKIQHMVSRYRGNKLWRVLDPRGFELEITSGCFEDIVFSGVVDKGLIIGPCIWRTGKILQRV